MWLGAIYWKINIVKISDSQGKMDSSSNFTEGVFFISFLLCLPIL